MLFPKTKKRCGVYSSSAQDYRTPLKSSIFAAKPLATQLEGSRWYDVENKLGTYRAFSAAIGRNLPNLTRKRQQRQIADKPAAEIKIL
jgi:hypothetical protein